LVRGGAVLVRCAGVVLLVQVLLVLVLLLVLLLFAGALL
jgi:hypothetical protein